MKVHVVSPFLPENTFVEVNEGQTIKQVFIEAQRISSCQENLDEAVRNFREDWYLFFRRPKGFQYWKMLEVKRVNGLKKSQVEVTDQQRPSTDMDTTLYGLKSTWELTQEIVIINIDIVGDIFVKVQISDSEDPSMLNNNIPCLNLPFESRVSVGIFIELTLLAVCYREGNGDPFCPGVMSWGIQFGTKDDWRYFTFDSEMSSMGLFYEKLRLGCTPHGKINLILTRSGSINVINGGRINFKFYEIQRWATDYLDKLPQGYETTFGRTKKLCFLVQQSKSGNLNLFPIFERTEDDPAAENALNSYLAIGELLKKPVILDNGEEEPSGKAFKEALDSLCEIACHMANNRCFTAICTPSFSGKTQLAFSVDKHVIYLPLLLDFTKAQSIYRGFEGHVKLLLDCVYSDYVLGKMGGLPYLTPRFVLEDSYLDNKSFTVGYFFTILQSLLSNVTSENIKSVAHEHSVESFLKRFGKMDGFVGKAIVPRTIDEFRKEFKGQLKNIFVFLDEFPSSFPGKYSTSASSGFVHLAVSLRNILRVMGIVCIVMGTDIQMANFPDSIHYTRSYCSRIDLEGIWCALITQFPRVPPSFFTHHAYKDLPSVQTLIGELQSFLLKMPMTPWCKDLCNEAIAKELGQFFMEQIQSSRPGLAWELVSIIYDHRDTIKQSSSVIDFLHFLCDKFSHFVSDRKKGIYEFGTVCSLLGNRLIGYYDAHEFSKSMIEFQKLIDQHFYYIYSPFDLFKSIQVLFLYSLPKDEEDELDVNLLIQSNFPFVAADDMKYDNYLSTSRYGVFQLFLPSPEEEFFLDTVLWNHWSNIKSRHVYSNQNAVGVAMRRHFQHSARLMSVDGKAAEDIWSSVVIDASHRKKFYPLAGESFLRAVVLSTEDCLISKKCSIADEQEELVRFSPNSSLKQQLNECVIPYLSAAGSFFSEILHSSFPSIFGKCIRMKNADMVDFAYEMKVLNRQDGQLYSAIGLVEMKGWENELSEQNIAEIIRRIPFSEYSLLTKCHFWGRCKLHFIFCQRLDINSFTHKIRNGTAVNMKCLKSRGFSRRGHPLNEVEDSESYHKFLEEQRNVLSKKGTSNKKVNDCQAKIDSLKKRSTDLFKESIQVMKEKLEKIKISANLPNHCYIPSDESTDNFTLEETEKDNAKKCMPPKDTSLSEILAQQKINLYYVDEIESCGLYELKAIYEDPSHDLISIVIPLQKSFGKIGNDDMSEGNVGSKNKRDNIIIGVNDDSLDIDYDGRVIYEEFNSYLTEELINAIGNLYSNSHPDGVAQPVFPSMASVTVKKDKILDNLFQDPQVNEQSHLDFDSCEDVAPKKYPKLN